MYHEALTGQRAPSRPTRHTSASPQRPDVPGRLLPAQHPLPDGVGADGRRRQDRARRRRKLDVALSDERDQQFAVMQPVKAAPYSRTCSSAPGRPRAARPRPTSSCWSRRCGTTRARVGLARKGAIEPRRRSTRSPRSSARPTSSRSTDWGVPARKSCARRAWWQRPPGRRQRRPAGRAAAYQEAVAVQDGLPYTEPPYWYYPVRQSLGAVRLRRAGATKPSRCSATRWRARPATAGRSRAGRGLPPARRRQGRADRTRVVRARLVRGQEGPELTRL